ncbi:hypothetical protein SK875_p00018 (plasmid) [Burkholderia contaminans]|nr:hypothetical protein SK875_p00018 [Burkholderia contaminans]
MSGEPQRAALKRQILHLKGAIPRNRWFHKLMIFR